MGDRDKWTKRGIFWTIVGITVTLFAVGITLYQIFWASGPAEPTATPTEPDPNATLAPVDEPALAPVEQATYVEGLPVHRRVPAASLAGDGWTFRGEAGDLVALTAVKSGESVVGNLTVAAVSAEGQTASSPSDEPTEYCPNLLGQESGGQAALFRLPRTGQYRVESTLEPSEREWVTLHAYSLAGSAARRTIDTARVVKGSMRYPGEVDLYPLEFPAGKRLSIHVRIQEESDDTAERLGVVRVLPDDSLPNRIGLVDEVWWDLTTKSGSVLALYRGNQQKPLDYTMTVRELAAPQGLAVEGQSVTGRLNFPGESDQYFIEVEAGSRWDVELACESPLKAKLDVEVPAGAVPKPGPCDPSCKVEPVAGAAGTMYIRVASYEGTEGVYQLLVWPAE